MYFRKSGKGKDALLFVHGWYQNGMQAWSTQIASFEKKYHIFVPDLLGHGLSTLADTKNFSIATNRAILTEFIHHIKKTYKIRRVILLGHSYGAFAVLDLISQTPNLIAGVVVLAAVDDYAPYVGQLKRILRFPFFLGFIYYRIQALLGLFPYGDRQLLYGNIIPSLYPKRLLYGKIKNKTLSLKNSRAYMRAFIHAKVIWPKEKIRTPILLLYGERDILTPHTHAKKIEPRFVSSSCKIILNAGHNVQISGAKIIEKDILKFIEK